MLNEFKIILKAGQNLVDIAQQYYGSAEGLSELCRDNGIAIGSTVDIGTELIIRNTNVKNKKQIAIYKRNNIIPASGSGAKESNWILAKGYWNDNKIWIDEETWRDN